jgi:hypothetical protein
MPIDKNTARERRQELKKKIQDELDEESSIVEYVLGLGKTVEDIVCSVCCCDQENGCNCNEVEQLYDKQTSMIEGLEAYLQAGNFTYFPKHTVLATSGPFGKRPKLSCCAQKIIEMMESALSLDPETIVSPILTDAIPQDIAFLVSSVFEKYTQEFYKKHAELELMRSQTTQNLLLDVYALCCIKD